MHDKKSAQCGAVQRKQLLGKYPSDLQKCYVRQCVVMVRKNFLVSSPAYLKNWIGGLGDGKRGDVLALDHGLIAGCKRERSGFIGACRT